MVQSRITIYGFDKAESEILKQRRTTIHNHLTKLKGEVNRNSPKATGQYGSGFRFRTFDRKEGVLAVFQNELDYAFYASNGRRKGKMPPYEAIAAWAKLKGIPESAIYPIRLKIAKEGTKRNREGDSHLGIDYQGNLVDGGLLDRSQKELDTELQKLRIT